MWTNAISVRAGHNAKDYKDAQKCAKCREQHRLSECESETEKCVNCVKGKSNVNHRANIFSYPSNSEEEKVRNNTDHGF